MVLRSPLPTRPARVFASCLLVSILAACGQAPAAASQDSSDAQEVLELQGAPIDSAPTPRNETADAQTPTALSLEEIYADPQATGSADARDQLAARALGTEVLQLRAAAKERAREMRELAADGDYAFLDFEALVFEAYQPPELRQEGAQPLGLEVFPEDARAWNGRKVQVAGFMIAVDFKDKRIEDFMLCRFPPGCCFGGIPLFDEWIDCTPAYEEKRDWSPYEMILVEGTLEVGERVDADGFALSLYRMRVDDVRPFE